MLKDYLKIGFFTFLIYTIHAIGGTVLMPLLATDMMPLIAGVLLFITTPFYLVLSLSIQKRNVLLVHSLYVGIIYSLFGMPLLLIYLGIGGWIGERVLRNHYGSIRRQLIAYGVYGAIYSLGSYVTLYILGEKAFRRLMDDQSVALLARFASSPLYG